ncbi:MAG: TerB family tellurite resistance protein [Alphaproteobacteria bacterium]
MLQRVGELLGLGPRPKASATDDARLAAAALLVEAALADGTDAPVEAAIITRLVRDRFGLDADAARALVDAGRASALGSADLVRHTRALKQALEPEDRVEILVALWQVVLADGTLDGYEDALVRQVAGLLHVTDRDRAAARRSAERRLAEGRC